MTQRFFQIGFNRAGTSSLADMLERAGLRAVHHSYERDGKKVNVALNMIANIEAGRPPLDGFDDIDAFTDIEYTAADCIIEGNRYFREIMAVYPDMKFVLNLRRKEDWLNSRLKFNDYPDRWMAYHNIGRDALVAMWSEHWDSHIAAVRAEIPADRLFVMDIDNPDEHATAVFFGLSPETLEFRQRNKSPRGPLAQFAQKHLPRQAFGLVPNRLKNALKNF